MAETKTAQAKAAQKRKAIDTAGTVIGSTGGILIGNKFLSGKKWFYKVACTSAGAIVHFTQKGPLKHIGTAMATAGFTAALSDIYTKAPVLAPDSAVQEQANGLAGVQRYVVTPSGQLEQEYHYDYVPDASLSGFVQEETANYLDW